MIFKTTRQIEKLAKKYPEIKRQFYLSSLEKKDKKSCQDPLLEEEYTKVRGLVHKYANRALILLTMNCAAYCRFCTRRRAVSDIKKGHLSEKDINNIVSYIKKKPGIREIIFSGGDPLTVPEILKIALGKITKLTQIKIIRIGTRLPVSDPNKIDQNLLSILKLVSKQPLYLMIHFEHPEEITLETISAVKKLRETGALLFSQSVFLKGVNDKYETLYNLFSKLLEIGIKPYYLFRCDPVAGAEHFIVPLIKEIEIMTKLRKNLSGLACPLYVIDAPNGSGKIPVPLNFWKFEHNAFRDFEEKLIKTSK